MVWFKSAAVFLLLSLNENVVASGTAEGIAASTVDAEGPAAANQATLNRKARAAQIPGARRAKRRKPISHAYKNHVKPYTPNARKLQEQGAAGEEVVQNGYVPLDPYHEHHYDTKATIHKPAHKPVPFTYTKGKGYVGKGYGYVEYEYEYRSKAMMSGRFSMKNAASYYDYEYYGYDTYGAKGKGVYYAADYEYRSKAMMSGGSSMSGGGGGAYYDYEYYGYDEYGMPIAPYPEKYPPYYDHAKYPLHEQTHMPEKKPAYDGNYATEKPVYDEHYATIKPGYDDMYPHDDMYKKPTPGKGYYYYEVERSKAMMKSSKSKMSGPETITYYYEYPMYTDDHYAHEYYPPKHPGGGVVPPPFAGPPGSGPPVSFPTPGGSPAPAGGGGGGGAQCFDDPSILIAAVDTYIADPSPDSALADTYGFPIGQWCVNGVSEFSYLFSIERNAAMSSFNENLSTWDVSNGVDFYAMFEGSAINQDFSSWDVSRGEDMGYMFSKASSFQGTGLGNWDVSSAMDTSYMFEGASAFNEDISSWNIGASLTTRSMFQDAVQFSQDLSSWSPVSVGDTTDMFNGTSSFSSNLCSWGMDLSPSTIVIGMFAASGCPLNEDPDLDATPPGPFCFAC